MFCELLNNRIVGVLEKESRISEGQAGFRRNRVSVNHVYTVGKLSGAGRGWG